MIEIEFAPGTANERTVNLSADASRLNPVRTHTGVGDFRGTIRGDRSLEQYAQRQDRINIKSDGDTIWTGYAVGISHNIQSGQTQISGDGIAKRLEETRPDYESIGGSVTYSSEALDDALRDYWDRTPFDNVTVYDQDTELVAENDEIQNADTTTEWENITPSFDATDPIAIQNGRLELAQSGFFVEGQDAGGGISGIVTGDDYSGGEAANPASTGDSVEFTVQPDYTIPAEEVVPAVRLHIQEDENGDRSHHEITVRFDGDTLATYTFDGLSPGISWREFQGDVTQDLEPDNSYTFTLETTDYDGGEDYYVDCMFVGDARYTSGFGDTVHEPGGYLDSPNLYPEQQTVTLNTVGASYNISAADITGAWNDTSNNQQIAVTNDNGDSFKTASNTDSVSADFDTAGRDIYVEFTLSRYGSRNTATPRTGFNGQSIDSYSLKIDGDNLVVISELELSRNHFDNLKTLHDFGDFLWVIEHDDGPIAEMPVSSFRRGEETRPAPDGFGNQVNQRPEIQSGTYYNSIYLEGELRDDGTRPTSEVKDQDAIDDDGREISPGILRDFNISTDAGAEFRAEALLDAALKNSDLVGTVTVPPVMTHPGYARPVDFGNGEQYKTVEKVSLNLGNNNADATFDFTTRTGLVDDIEGLKQDTKGLGNQV